ncbi:MAG TPA: bifunctional 23S rRNA (guanine(2069)-N(7))-methyltransferase RlmK/23S rRNA (guanine(2445)-N(2))-methyltransferase RlmL [Steroidobacteraceae bacterium]|jgi:23S rRNA (guanine2445-N2)-methyltransferase / 23S rRNA (guanine2069-N7)-methyltransferase|nr:bifunctional 23S rRNA (guanine(2069)-N(7))-methyltransferase RlmK/23S rRNA (guanine(2445)-N(2))-methyltransferase RlmL [Steroidobacteraceae bacterium]
MSDALAAEATLALIASCPRGLADLLVQELNACGATQIRERTTGVSFQGTLECAYRVCLESRTANRLFLEIARFDAASADEFYAQLRRIDWTQHLGPQATLACDFSGQHPQITHTHFGALKLKDAICDGLRAWAGQRPDVQRERPGVRVHAHANGEQVTVSIDLSGESLHRRGYRAEAGEAPLKENVAAGILLRAGWPQLAADGAGFLDPMCGSGTLVIEAALIAAERAPGLGRDYFGFLGWRGHDPQLWARVRTAAQARQRELPAGHLPLRGIDRDAASVRAATTNAQRAGIAPWAHFASGLLAQARPLPGQTMGLVVTNPPYGVRMEDMTGARVAHRELGIVLREEFQGWHAAVFTGTPELGLELGIRARRTHTMWNGAIECRLLRLTVASADFREVGRKRTGLTADAQSAATPGARMFANRLAKNLKRLGSWARDQGVFNVRLYDADMPEYALAIDRYGIIGEAGSEEWLYVQEYEAPASIDPDAARRRRGEALSVLSEVTGVPGARIRVRLRRRQSGAGQYRKLESQAVFHTAREAGQRFWVNFDDYLDTGLFLDHRITRERLGAQARGGRFLNLFCYTATATVHAAAGGARASTSVDMSRPYLQWARRNLDLNGIAREPHELIQADCRQWLDEAVTAHERYDLIFLDPPTFSNSKRMEGVLDVSRDHSVLIERCTQLLNRGGLLVFSTNAQRFKLDAALSDRHDVTDISRATIAVDFERNPRIHRCFEIRPRLTADP